MINLIKDVLANGLNKNYRENLISNFKEIERGVNELCRQFQKLQNDNEDNKKTQQETDNKALNDMEQKMNDKIKRITLGTDKDTVRLVVTAILQEQGVIK